MSLETLANENNMEMADICVYIGHQCGFQRKYDWKAHDKEVRRNAINECINILRHIRTDYPVMAEHLIEDFEELKEND